MDRYNTAVDHTLPHGTPMGQQVHEFPRRPVLRSAWATGFAECQEYPILCARKRGLFCEHRFFSSFYSYLLTHSLLPWRQRPNPPAAARPGRTKG